MVRTEQRGGEFCAITPIEHSKDPHIQNDTVLSDDRLLQDQQSILIGDNNHMFLTYIWNLLASALMCC